MCFGFASQFTEIKEEEEEERQASHQMEEEEKKQNKNSSHGQSSSASIKTHFFKLVSLPLPKRKSESVRLLRGFE